MEAATLHVRFDTLSAFESEFEQNLRHGGTFVKDVGGFAEHEAVEAIIVHPVNGTELSLSCEVVWVSVSPDHPGVGLAVTGFSPDIRNSIEAFLKAPPDRSPSEPEDAPKSAEQQWVSPHAKLRGLSGPEQIRVAQGGNPSERMMLERIYGKMVWEPILRNSRVTVPEVARIANMGALPQHLFELIGANSAWLRVPQIRRALLGNLKTPPHVVEKVLRLAPRGEVRLAARQTTYSKAVRDKARRLIERY